VFPILAFTLSFQFLWCVRAKCAEASTDTA